MASCPTPLSRRRSSSSATAASWAARTVAERLPGAEQRLNVTEADALVVDALDDPQPTAVVANLPYNVSVPVLLHVLARFPTVRSGLVMVQWEAGGADWVRADRVRWLP